MILQGLIMLVFSLILSILLIFPITLIDVDSQLLIDVFTFPADIIPFPYNLSGILLIPVGLLLVAWANHCSYSGKLASMMVAAATR